MAGFPNKVAPLPVLADEETTGSTAPVFADVPATPKTGLAVAVGVVESAVEDALYIA